MSHVRKQVRDALVATLTGLPSTGSRVSANRSLPLTKGAGLSLAVRVASEASEDLSMGRMQARVMTLVLAVSGKAATEDDLADALDASAVEIERTLALSPTLGTLVQDLTYRGAEFVLSAEGETISGALALTYEATVYTAANNPETAL